MSRRCFFETIDETGAVISLYGAGVWPLGLGHAESSSAADQPTRRGQVAGPTRRVPLPARRRVSATTPRGSGHLVFGIRLGVRALPRVWRGRGDAPDERPPGQREVRERLDRRGRDAERGADDARRRRACADRTGRSEASEAGCRQGCRRRRRGERDARRDEREERRVDRVDAKFERKTSWRREHVGSLAFRVASRPLRRRKLRDDRGGDGARRVPGRSSPLGGLEAEHF